MSINIANKYNTETKYDMQLSNFIAAYFLVQALNLFVKLVIGSFYGWDYITRGILIIFLVFCIVPIIRRGLIGAIIVELALIGLFSYTLVSGGIVFSENSSIIVNSVTVFMPMAICVFLIRDKQILLNRLYYLSWPSQFLLIAVLLSMNNVSYSMIGGYSLVFQLLIVFDRFLLNHKWYDLIMVIIDAFFIAVFGSRGPILCIGAMILLYLLFSHKLSLVKKTLIIVAVVLGIVILYSNINNIVNSFVSLLRIAGFQSRSVRLLSQNLFNQDSGRSALYSYYIQMVSNRPVFGFGLAGGWLSAGEYPHHLFIEFLVSFGIVFGLIACVIVVALMFRAILSKDEIIQRLSIILVSYCICLFLSDSFVLCPIFYMMVAVGLSSLRIRFTLQNV